MSERGPKKLHELSPEELRVEMEKAKKILREQAKARGESKPSERPEHAEARKKQIYERTQWKLVRLIEEAKRELSIARAALMRFQRRPGERTSIDYVSTTEPTEEEVSAAAERVRSAIQELQTAEGALDVFQRTGEVPDPFRSRIEHDT